MTFGILERWRQALATVVQAATRRIHGRGGQKKRGKAMRVKVTAPFVELGKGTVLSGLSEDQLHRRRLCLTDLGNGQHQLTEPTHFKQGETLELADVPKSLREFVSVESEQALPGHLEAMTRVELVELAEERGVTISSSASKQEIIAALDAEPQKGTPTALVPDPLPEGLDDMKRDDLVELAEERGVAIAGNATKHEIVLALRRSAKRAA
jgi:Rho termination factor, N-terminal domain